MTTPGGLQHPQLSSMLAVSSVTFSSVRLLTGEKMKIISNVSIRKHLKIWSEIRVLHDLVHGSQSECGHCLLS